MLFDYSAHHFLKLWSGQHDKTSAATAFDAEIHAGTQYLPQIAAAGMLLFHPYHITHIIMYPFHCHHPLPVFPTNPIVAKKNRKVQQK